MKNMKKKIAVFAGLLPLLFAAGAGAQSVSNSNSNANLAKRRVGPRAVRHALSSATPTATGLAEASSSTSYTFGYLDFPQAAYTEVNNLNLGAASSRMLIVGGAGSTGLADGSGFLLDVSEIAGTTYEAFNSVTSPGSSSSQQAGGINDFGQIVGYYTDSNGNYQGYRDSGGIFTQIQVPFPGATGTLPEAINNSGEIVGPWLINGDYYAQGFELKGGVYTSIGYPDAAWTVPFNINSKGDVVGLYNDSAGVDHGFLLSEGTYTSIDFPGAIETVAFGINDGGAIVGYYCATTTDCTAGNDQGFLLSGGVFTTVNAPGACWTEDAGISNNGVIVGDFGDCGTGSGMQRSFVAYP